MDGTTRMERFLAVDFFCGAGGTSLGAIQAGATVLAGIDRDPNYRATYSSNIVNADGTRAEFLNLDLAGVDKAHPGGQREEVLNALDQIFGRAWAISRTRPLLFIFCPPCQPFTSVNRGKLSADMEASRKQDRNLLYHSLAYIKAYEPEAILCENVSGIQDKKFGGIWQHFEAAVAEAGYHVGSAVVDTANFGIAQTRRRSIMLGVRKDVFAGGADDINDNGRLRLPDCDTHAAALTVRHAIGHLPPLMAGETHAADPDHRASSVSDLNRRRLAAAPAGGTNALYRGTDLEVGCHARLRDRMDREGRKAGGYTDAYTRLHPDRPAPTITTKCFSFSNGRFGHYDTGQHRALSIREAACLQSFPENFSFNTESIASAAKMIGNAVPPRLAAFFVRRLHDLIQMPSE